MKTNKFVAVILVMLMLLGTVNFSVFAENGEPAIVKIGDVQYKSLPEAFENAKEGDTLELFSGIFELGSVVMPAELINVTIKGAPDKSTVIKNSVISSATEGTLNYTGVVFDGIVFDNSRIALKGNGTGTSVFKNWTITNCEFKNLETPGKNLPVMDYNYTDKALFEKMVNFTFSNNIIDGVSGGNNVGLRIKNAAGKIVISNNTIKNIPWNAIQIWKVHETSLNDTEDDPTIEFTNNNISGAMAEEGIINLHQVKCKVFVSGNTFQKSSASQPYFCYVNTHINMSENVWLDENGNAVSDEEAMEGLEKNPELDKAIARLETLGITKGMANGYFGEKEKVTREQMTAFIYRLLHKGESLENGENLSSFTDITNSEFFGMISWANEKKIIKGISETEFNPNGTITLQDAYTICLRALGYEESEELVYPDGYINLAKKLRLSDNLKAKENNEVLTRGDVAIVLYNTLYAKMKSGENVATDVYERNILDGKKVLFVGNSYTYHGLAVFRKSRSVLDLDSRRNDTGYFYQLAKTNGAEPSITNWTWGGHGLSDIFSSKCSAERECKGVNHLSAFTDYDYDYVFLQEKGALATAKPEDVINLSEKFKAVNPDVKIILLVPHAGYVNGTHKPEYVSQMKELGFTVVEWGKLVADIIKGDVEVPGAKEQYNKNSFIVAQSETDGYHQNVLAGYLTALMAYCAVTEESAVGQSYEFCNDKKLNSQFDFETYAKDYYTYDNATTNFPQIFASADDMKGLQILADQYLAQ